MVKLAKSKKVPAKAIITTAILRKWNPCAEGYKRFCELFPEGADLKTAAEGLDADGHNEWAIWLFNKCRRDASFKNQAELGFKNAGDWNAGNWNAGNRNAGNWNAGDWNAGNRNAGNRNAGNWNAGNRNAGDWNAGNWNAGHFNTICPSEITVFNKPCSYKVWEKAPKPDFIFCVEPTRWISESQMTDAEKVQQPKFYVAGGYLKRITFKEAWSHAWSTATSSDKSRLLNLPNFDADVFMEISGIDVRA